MPNFNNYDVIIIGAGPAGAEAAKHFAHAGYSTLVLEEQLLNREKACGGGIFVQEIIEFGPLPTEVIERSIRQLTIASPNYSHTLELPATLPAAAIVKRSVYDNYLQQEAKKVGAEFIDLAKIVAVDLHPSHGEVTVKINNQEKMISARLIIDASGAKSLLAKKLGIIKERKPEDYIISLQYWLEIPKEDIDRNFSDRIEFHFGSKLVPEGYVWIFPKKEVVGVGIGGLAKNIFEQSFKLKPALDNFINTHPLLKNGKIVLTQGGLIPSTIHPQIYGPSAIFVGEAAGIASPIHGGGIYYARKSAQIAFEFGDTYLKTDNKKHLQEYDKKSREVFYDQEFKWDYKMRSFFDHDDFIDVLVRGAKTDQKAASFYINLFTGVESHAKVYRQGEEALTDLLTQHHPVCDEKKCPDITPIPQETSTDDLKSFSSSQILIVFSYCLKGLDCPAKRFSPECLRCGKCQMNDLISLVSHLNLAYRIITTSHDFLTFMDNSKEKYKGLLAVSCPQVANRLGYLVHKKYKIIGFNLFLKENICLNQGIYHHSEKGNKKEQTRFNLLLLKNLLSKIT